MDEQYCQLIYEIGLNSFQKIHTHPSPREAVEMCLLRMLAFQPVQNMNTGEAKTQKKKTNKAQVKTVKKEKPQINEEVSQESHEINSSSWPALFNDMQLSSFAKNYFGNLSFARFNDQKIFLCGSKDQLDIPEKIISEFEEKIKDKFGNIEIGLEEGISSSSPNKINEENKIKSEKKKNKIKKVKVSKKILQGKVEEYKGSKFYYEKLDGVDVKNLRNLIDVCKKDIKSGIVCLISSYEGKISIAIGVTDDLLEKFNAVDLVKICSEIMGGKGGGGRKDMALAGAKNLDKSEDAFKKLLENFRDV